MNQISSIIVESSLLSSQRNHLRVDSTELKAEVKSQSKKTLNLHKLSQKYKFLKKNNYKNPHLIKTQCNKKKVLKLQNGIYKKNIKIKSDNVEKIPTKSSIKMNKCIINEESDKSDIFNTQSTGSDIEESENNPSDYSNFSINESKQ